LYNDLKSICDRIEKQTVPHRVLSLAFFTGANAAAGELVLNGRVDRTSFSFRFGIGQNNAGLNFTSIEYVRPKNSQR
jgi:hypothetical protein